MAPPSLLAPRLRCQEIVLRFGKKHVLNSFSLDILRGETIAILGRSGSGKTTALKAINLLICAESGRLELDGQTYFLDGSILYNPREIRTIIGMVFQGFNLFPNMTGRQNIELALRRVKRLDKAQIASEVSHVAEQLGIEGVLRRYPESLSGGEAQRVALARAIVLRPEVLLLDEITSSLDPETTRMVFDALFALKRKSPDLSIVIVTHAVHFAVRFADRIALLHDGSLVDLLPASEFLKSASHAASKEYLSELLAFGA